MLQTSDNTITYLKCHIHEQLKHSDTHLPQDLISHAYKLYYICTALTNKLLIQPNMLYDTNINISNISNLFMAGVRQKKKGYVKQYYVLTCQFSGA